MDKVYDLIVLGAGPAGIAVAYEAELLGTSNILMIEKNEKSLNTIRNFYEDGKPIDRDWAGIEVDLIGNIDFKFVKEEKIVLLETILENSKNIEVNYCDQAYDIQKQGELFHITTHKSSYKAKNLVVAIGRMDKPKKPDYRLPRKLGKKIHFDLNFQAENEKILVVGGGDSASEYACSLSKSNEVTICYRQKEFTRPNPLNLKKLKEKLDCDALCCKMATDIEAIDVTEDKRAEITFTNGDREIYDRMVFALGGTTPIDFLRNLGIEVDTLGQPVYDDNFETNIKNIYVIGDIIYQNGGSISSAYNQGYHVAKYLT